MGRIVKRKKELILILLIILIAAFFRLYRIYDYAIFLGDEGRDALIVRKMIVDRRPTLLGPSTSVGNLYLGPLYYYLMILPLWMANFDPVGSAVMVAFLGIATVYLIFKIGEALFDSTTGILAASFYAISQPIIDHTRFSWNPNPIPFFVSLAVFSFLKVITGKKNYWWLLLGACLGACPHLHYVSLVFVLIMGLWIIIFRKKINKQGIFLGLLVFLLVLSPILIFDLRHQWLISRGFWRFFTQEKKLGFQPLNYFGKIIAAYQRLFYYFLAASHRWLGVLLTLLGSLSFFLLLRLKNKENIAFKILATWWFLGLAGAAFYVGELHDHYLGFLFPLPFLLMAFFITYLFKKKLFLLAGLIVIVIVWVNVRNLDLIAGRAPNCQIIRAKLVAKSIAQEVTSNERFNLALISPTLDFRAMNYRYFVEVFGAKPESFENYTDIDTLFVIIEQEEIPTTDMTAWEIASFGESETVKKWRFEEFGFQVLKLKKRRLG